MPRPLLSRLCPAFWAQHDTTSFKSFHPGFDRLAGRQPLLGERTRRTRRRISRKSMICSGQSAGRDGRGPESRGRGGTGVAISRQGGAGWRHGGRGCRIVRRRKRPWPSPPSLRTTWRICGSAGSRPPRRRTERRRPGVDGTNKVAGAVLDLRFAGGEDYAAAREAAGLLADKESSRPFAGPLVVLVNGGTRGAAETLAAALRAAGAALIIGSPTAGGAMTFKEFPLKDGERLLMATAPVKVDGPAVPADGLKPDIAVAVNAGDERAFWRESLRHRRRRTRTSAKAATNSFLPFVDRTSEADLVRQQQKDGKLINLPLPLGRRRGRSETIMTTTTSMTMPCRRLAPAANSRCCAIRSWRGRWIWSRAWRSVREAHP